MWSLEVVFVLGCFCVWGVGSCFGGVNCLFEVLSLGLRFEFVCSASEIWDGSQCFGGSA